jgi:signal peptidase I
MKPVLQPGDLAVSVKPARLQPGDIVSYRSSTNPQEIVSHRLIKNYPSRGYVITKGDNLTQPDPAVPLSAVTGRTIKVIPKLGYLVDTLKSLAGMVGLIYLPALALASYELSRLLTVVNYRSYGVGGQKH